MFTKEWYKTHEHPKGMLGKVHTQTAKDMISKGNKGKVLSDRHRKILSDKMVGIKNPMWRGDQVSYIALHDWVKRNKVNKGICENCKKKKDRLDLHNINSLYLRNINDWVYLCRRCHMLLDKRMYTRSNDGKFKARS